MLLDVLLKQGLKHHRDVLLDLRHEECHGVLHNVLVDALLNQSLKHLRDVLVTTVSELSTACMDGSVSFVGAPSVRNRGGQWDSKT